MTEKLIHSTKSDDFEFHVYKYTNVKSILDYIIEFKENQYRNIFNYPLFIRHLWREKNENIIITNRLSLNEKLADTTIHYNSIKEYIPDFINKDKWNYCYSNIKLNMMQVLELNDLMNQCENNEILFQELNDNINDNLHYYLNHTIKLQPSYERPYLLIFKYKNDKVGRTFEKYKHIQFEISKICGYNPISAEKYCTIFD